MIDLHEDTRWTLDGDDDEEETSTDTDEESDFDPGDEDLGDDLGERVGEHEEDPF